MNQPTRGLVIFTFFFSLFHFSCEQYALLLPLVNGYSTFTQKGIKQLFQTSPTSSAWLPGACPQPHALRPLCLLYPLIVARFQTTSLQLRGMQPKEGTALASAGLHPAGSSATPQQEGSHSLASWRRRL